MKALLTLLLFPTIALAAQTEEQAATQFGISVYELRIQKCIQFSQRLAQLRAAERDGVLRQNGEPITELTKAQKDAMRAKRVGMHGEFLSICKAVTEVD